VLSYSTVQVTLRSMPRGVTFISDILSNPVE